MSVGKNGMELMILYEDRDIIVCHKRAGTAVQNASLVVKDMVSMLNNYLAEEGNKAGCCGENGKREKDGGRMKNQGVYVVHRLDQPVEGVIVFAKTQKAASSLSKQISQGDMKKIYRAVCCMQESGAQSLNSGNTNADAKGKAIQEKYERGKEYRLEDYLLKDGKTNTSLVVQKNVPNAKRAGLSFKVLDIFEKEKKRYLAAEINLETGRHHQIRVQMAHAGLPLYGDRKYNGRWKEYLTEARPERESTQLALCAVSLTFRHPATGKSMTFETEPEMKI